MQNDSTTATDLADDAKALLAATADVAGEKVAAARHRLATALEKGKEAWGRVQEKAYEGAKEVDQVVRKHPYETAGVAFGLGLLLGFLLTRRD
jgi:ElaB/YqjD/DUF883 family membrane-anchored ribosome-binding protein